MRALRIQSGKTGTQKNVPSCEQNPFRDNLFLARVRVDPWFLFALQK